MVGSDLPNNPDQGVDIDFTPQVDEALPARQIFPHIFPANKGAWSRFRGPLPQLGSVLNLIKRPPQ